MIAIYSCYRRLKRIARELDRNAAAAKSIYGQSRRINYLLSDIKQGKKSYASSVACVVGSPVTVTKGLSIGVAIYKPRRRARSRTSYTASC